MLNILGSASPSSPPAEGGTASGAVDSMGSLLAWAFANQSFMVALFALSISTATFFLTKRRDKRDLFLKVHERQLDLELQEGRRLLYDAFVRREPDFKFMQENDPEVYAKVNRSLAMLDVMGLYAEKKYVNEKLVLAEWGQTLAQLAPKARQFMEHRGPKAWPHLARLLNAATSLHTTVPEDQTPLL